jgi:hypothetical protein
MGASSRVAFLTVLLATCPRRPVAAQDASPGQEFTLPRMAPPGAETRSSWTQVSLSVGGLVPLDQRRILGDSTALGVLVLHSPAFEVLGTRLAWGLSSQRVPLRPGDLPGTVPLTLSRVVGTGRALREIRPPWSAYCEFSFGFAITTGPGVDTGFSNSVSAGCGVVTLMQERVPVGLGLSYLLADFATGYVDPTIDKSFSALLVLVDVGYQI